VQGRADPQREILDVESVAGHLLPPGGMFAFLAGHRRELFPEEMFADLFKPGGRPSVPAEVIARTGSSTRSGWWSGRPGC
jgi:hypothetical protein